MEDKQKHSLRSTQIGIVLGGLVTTSVTDVLAQGGLTGMALGGVLTFIAVKEWPRLVQWAKETFPEVTSISKSLNQPPLDQRSVLDRLTGNHPDPKQALTEVIEPSQLEQVIQTNRQDDELIAPVRKRSGVFLFSEVLKDFVPTLDKIYIGTLPTGEMLFCKAEALCHVALAGATDAGKSSIMRMLMAQLCKAGARILLLNPHHTGYVLDKSEDWTPFTPYLADDPLKCAEDYRIIAGHLKNIAEQVIPNRLSLYRHSQPIGRPIFLVLDELPAIVKHIPETSEYLDSILKEGRKIGILLISASQDFLVKTLGGTGAVRDCYRTCFYVGGDAQTARVLLGEVPDNEETLGKGTIVLRNATVCKKPLLVYVPLVDNAALYKLLGPSTYSPSQKDRSDDLRLISASERAINAVLTPKSIQTTKTIYHPRDRSVHRLARMQRLRAISVTPDGQIADTQEANLSADERAILNAYREGRKTGNAIAGVTGIPATRVNQLLNRLGPQLGLIDWKPRTKI